MALAGALGGGLRLDLGLVLLAVRGELIGALGRGKVEGLNGDIELVVRELARNDLAVGLSISLASSVCIAYEQGA